MGFRYFARESANSVGVTGWVRNESDGSVSMEAQANQEIVALFIEHITQGASMGYVREIVKHEIPVIDNEKGFLILR
ncbi:MAG: acylphosphatase [Chitinivibrionales bacterium]|nr:acylphosphatase [Chitinivibrionales bacterium]